MIARRLTATLAVIFIMISHASAQMLLRDAEIEKWIEDYAHPLLEAAGLPPETIDIYLIGDQTPNAFAGGRIMGIHTGLFTMAETPNQIEGVIAHETGHIAGGHTARTDDAMASATTPMLLSLILAAGAVAAGAPDAGLGILGLGQTVGIANLLKYSRGQESAADQAAITYLDRGGRSSRGLIEFFGKLRNYQIITGNRINPYLQSHPLAQARMTALQERATRSPYYDNVDSEEEIERLRMIQAKILGFMQEPRTTLRQYPLRDQSDAARYARAVAYYRDSQIEKGIIEIDRLIEAHPDNQYFHELKGQMLFEHGRVAESIPPHRRSVELDPGSALLRINLGRALLASETLESTQESVSLLRSALLIEPDNAFAWFELARAYGALGQEGQANLATAESRFHSGRVGEAAVFARRARTILKEGTPEWRQAGDIMAAAQAAHNGKDGPPVESDVPPLPKKPPEERRPDGDVPDPQAF